MPNTIKSFLEINKACVYHTILDADMFVDDLSQNEYVVGHPKPFAEYCLLF